MAFASCLAGCAASSTNSSAQLDGNGTLALPAATASVGTSGDTTWTTSSTTVAQGGAVKPAAFTDTPMRAQTAAIAPSAHAPTRSDIAASAAAARPGSNAYRIGEQDVVDISVFKVPELSKSVQVAESGTINLPLLGEVQAAGRTARELERDLTIALGTKYLQSPQVTVFVREYNSQRVTLEGGGIKKPGVYALKGRMTLLQLVATAEGLSDISDSELSLFRQANSKKNASTKYSVAAIRSGEAEDPELVAGDVIVASTSASKEAFNNVLKAVPLATALRPF